MSDSDILKDISDDLRYYIKETVPNSVYKNADDPTPGGGGGGGALVCTVTEDSGTFTLDKTAGEIIEAVNAGLIVWAKMEYNDEGFDQSLILNLAYDGESYVFVVSTVEYEAASLDDYPSYTP